MLPAEQRALMEHSRGAQHHECPLWASLRYNTALLISHRINFTLSTNLFCNSVHRSKLPLKLWSREALQRASYIHYSLWCCRDAGKDCFSISLFMKTVVAVALQRKMKLYLNASCVIFWKVYKERVLGGAMTVYLVKFPVALMGPPWFLYSKKQINILSATVSDFLLHRAARRTDNTVTIHHGTLKT